MRRFCIAIPACCIIVIAAGDRARAQSGNPPPGDASGSDPRSVLPRPADSALFAAAWANAVAEHAQQTKDQATIFNGRVYSVYPYTFMAGTPFFPPGHFQAGSVLYDNTRYEGIPLLYDDYADALVADIGVNLELVPEKVATFSLGLHRFERIDEPPAGRPVFAEIIAEGKLTLYHKPVKTIKKLSAKQTDPMRNMDVVDRYFIKKNGRLFPANEKAQWLRLMADHAQDVGTFIRDNRLSFGEDKYGVSLGKTVTFYNQLPAL